LDNDGLLDVFLLMKSKSNKSYVGIIQGDTVIKDTGVAIAIGNNDFPLFHRRHIL
jgi:hypothetical protein